MKTGDATSKNLNSLLRFKPEPKSSLSNTFTQVLSGVGSAVGAAAGISTGADLSSLLNAQIEVQREMQVVSMHSNVERSKHEMKMAAIRNMRTG